MNNTTGIKYLYINIFHSTVNFNENKIIIIIIIIIKIIFTIFFIIKF